jgi:hypothetical protein
MEIAGKMGWEKVRFRGRFSRARTSTDRFYLISSQQPQHNKQTQGKKMKTNVSFLCGAALFLGAALFCQSVQAQLTLSGTDYTQNFDALSNGLPNGWSLRIDATATTLGTIMTDYIASGKTWGDTGGEFGNCASTVANSGTNFTGNESSTIQNGCTNRALAIRQTGSFGDPGAAFVLNLANTRGMTNFQLGLDFLILSVQPRSTIWTVDYAIGDNPDQFTPLTTFDDPGAFGATHTDLSFGTALDDQDDNIWIRIVALSATTGSSSRDTFGIDNLSLSWEGNNVSPVTPSISRIELINGNAQIDFTADTGDSPSSFTLQCATQMSDTFADTDATITQTSPGNFHAECAMGESQQFYRIKRP